MSHPASRKDMILKHSLRALLRRQPVAFAMLGMSGFAIAGPTGEDVVGGDADIIRPDAVRTVINQLTDRAAINWQTFNVDADEYVIFNQPGASSIVLNRVLGGDASYILGHLQANGQVFLLNPHGVFFTHGAALDVQGFLGSTLDMSPAGFMNGDYTLTRNAQSPANTQVINDGSITAGPGGYVVLAGDYTENTGIIAANAGTVALVSGNALTLDIEGDGLVNFAIDEATLSEAAGVRNAGSLIADGGRVIMTAKVANDLVATAVNNEGLVRARSIEERNGEIFLVGHGGDVVNNGVLDADGENADGGGIALYSDRDVTLADGGVQTAAGDVNHDGGVIRAIAEEHLDYQQNNIIRATGGMNGGFVEVSGHGSINLRGIPQIGAGGTFLIDPTHIFIYDGLGSPVFGSSATFSYTSVGTGYLSNQLDSGVDVVLVANTEIRYDDSLNGTITGTNPAASLTMTIGTISSPGGASDVNGLQNVLLGGAPDILPGTGGTIDITGLMIDIAGDVSLIGQTIQFETIATAGDVIVDGANITGTSIGSGAAGTPGTVTITADGAYPANINLTGDVIARDHISITVNGFGPADGAITVGDVRTTSSSIDGDIVLMADGGYSGGGSITINGVANAAGDLVIDASGSGAGAGSGGNITVTGTLNAGGDITVLATRAGGGKGAEINVSGTITAGNNVTITANGLNNAGRIFLGSVEFAGSDLAISATGSSDATSAAGVIELSWIRATGGGDVTLGAVHTTGSLGGYASFSTITSATNVSVTANGSGSNDGWITGGQIADVAGVVNLTANGGLGVSGGNILLGSAGSSGNAGGSFHIIATGLQSGGNITLGSAYADVLDLQANGSGSGSGGNITFGGAGNTISATGSITLDAAAGSGSGGANISGTGSLDAGGSLILLTNISSGISGGNITIEDASGALITVIATGGSDGGDVSITGDLTATSGNINVTANGGFSGGGNIDVIGGNVQGAGNVTLNAF
ncbi:MAG TPA: filamentous hemagglutinin N-terminal domain-containing protein, partial [Gammaproteobacteria bacterium]